MSIQARPIIRSVAERMARFITKERPQSDIQILAVAATPDLVYIREVTAEGRVEMHGQEPRLAQHQKNLYQLGLSKRVVSKKPAHVVVPRRHRGAEQ